MTISRILRRLDAYPRPEEHLTQQTASGAVVSVVGVSLMLILFLWEFSIFITPATTHEMSVDLLGGELLPIHFNITFPALPCSLVGVDALDMSGKHEVDVETNVYKVQLDRNGRHTDRKEKIVDLVKSNTTDQHSNNTLVSLLSSLHLISEGTEDIIRERRADLDSGQGCNIHGKLDVARVAGNFHFSIHTENVFIMQSLFSSTAQMNLSHHIHTLAFGPEFPGAVNPLDNSKRIVRPSDGDLIFRYFIKIVPTVYKSLGGAITATNQYSVTEYNTTAQALRGSLPTVFFIYDFSPIAVTVQETRKHLGHFLTRICAVVGGSFAVTGMLDRFIFLIAERMKAS